MGRPARIGAATAPAADAPGLHPAEAHPPLGTLRGLGRLLFGQYLYAVELAGTLLLIATIGAIAMAPRRSHGGL
jgi:NADH-quinone oxidoreductase subunit J